MVKGSAEFPKIVVQMPSLPPTAVAGLTGGRRQEWSGQDGGLFLRWPQESEGRKPGVKVGLEDTVLSVKDVLMIPVLKQI